MLRQQRTECTASATPTGDLNQELQEGGALLLLYRLVPKFPRRYLKLGGVLRGWAVGTETRVASISTISERSQQVHRYDANGEYYDVVGLKTSIPGKNAK